MNSVSKRFIWSGSWSIKSLSLEYWDWNQNPCRMGRQSITWHWGTWKTQKQPRETWWNLCTHSHICLSCCLRKRIITHAPFVPLRCTHTRRSVPHPSTFDPSKFVWVVWSHGSDGPLGNGVVQLDCASEWSLPMPYSQFTWEYSA